MIFRRLSAELWADPALWSPRRRSRTRTTCTSTSRPMTMKMTRMTRATTAATDRRDTVWNGTMTSKKKSMRVNFGGGIFAGGATRLPLLRKSPSISYTLWSEWFTFSVHSPPLYLASSGAHINKKIFKKCIILNRWKSTSPNFVFDRDQRRVVLALNSQPYLRGKALQ